MRTSLLTILALGAATINAGVIRKRVSSGQTVVYWGQDDSENSLGSYCAADQGIDIIVLAFLSTAGNGNTPSGNFGNECSIDSTGQGSCGTLAADINTCKNNGKKPLTHKQYRIELMKELRNDYTGNKHAGRPRKRERKNSTLHLPIKESTQV